ncbi:molybdopterin-dependent oxidoreductase [Falsiruegeria litorea]|uniref:Oxidoreductase n=1 Tax=Falsiruegeria litorea TaxID=1280831 RepID=A0ABS5WMZ4_9RHOB|nr:molybdopterin-dependent oxidoreductase [Falsiruegeria litorea]MBT3140445.1 oxidoreductase [Falsiruegeria litorea]MBT8169620.1 oxidoreductase [Falsiruegeria litorea]
MGFVTQCTAALTLLFLSAISTVASETILTVSGLPVASGSEATVEFELEELRRIGEITFSTTTPWTEGEQTFTGVPLATFVSSLDLKAGVLKATAVNDYAVEIPVSEALFDGPIIAYLKNDERMSIREKGPLWLVYPYDSDAKFRTEIVYSRSIWQLDRIVVSE